MLRGGTSERCAVELPAGSASSAAQRKAGGGRHISSSSDEKQEEKIGTQIRSMAAEDVAAAAVIGARLPREYGYVVLAIVVYALLNFWMAAQVGRARKRYNVLYPTMYAVESENKDAKLFNCIQRGHQNSLELMPLFFVTLVMGGLQHPLLAASLGAVYVITRFFYFMGYSTGVPEKRLKIGGLNFVALMGLLMCTASLGIHLLIRQVL